MLGLVRPANAGPRREVNVDEMKKALEILDRRLPVSLSTAVLNDLFAAGLTVVRQLNKEQTNELLARWDQTQPEIQRGAVAKLAALNCMLTDQLAALRQQNKTLEAALRKARSFVGHAELTDEWCGCEGCRKEWEEIKAKIDTLLAKPPAEAGEGKKR